MLERCAMIFVISAVSSMVVGRFTIRALKALGWIQPKRHEDCPPLQPLQAAKGDVPTMGGLWVLGVAASVAIGFGGVARLEGWVVLGTMVSFGIVGAVDDLLKFKRPNAKGLSILPKLMVAILIGGVVARVLTLTALETGRVLVPWLGTSVNLGWLWLPFVCLVIAGCAHGVNLTDGMDGLAVGCLVVAFVVIGVLVLTRTPEAWAAAHMVHALSHEGLVATWCASLAGACVGFLWFNSLPATVFLGDVGALGLGGALGVLALLSYTALGLIVIGGIFVVEAGSVILQVASFRWANRRRIFRVAPLHHHVQLGGLSEPKVVVRFWIVGLLLAALGVSAMSRS